VACQTVAQKTEIGKTHGFWRAMKPKTLDDLRTDLASNLKSIRLAKGIAQERLAFDAGVDRSVVSKIERGVTNPSLDVLLRLSNNLGVEVSDLLKRY
jgi:ribosome-binding protein aMBF1 (putative translation factor)